MDDQLFEKGTNCTGPSGASCMRISGFTPFHHSLDFSRCRSCWRTWLQTDGLESTCVSRSSEGYRRRTWGTLMYVSCAHRTMRAPLGGWYVAVPGEGSSWSSFAGSSVRTVGLCSCSVRPVLSIVVIGFYKNGQSQITH